MLWNGYPQPWRGWLLALSAAIIAGFIIQITVAGGWVLFAVIAGLLAIQLWLAWYARKQS